MEHNIQPLLYVILVAVITFLTRAFPFALFGGKRKVPSPVLYLGRILPPAVMCILVIYCLRNVNFSSVSSFLPQIISVVIVALLHLWKRNNLLSIGVGTIVYMILIQFVFI
ncbi:branched-chain amino acid transporter permease [Parasporobacterium paucivorans]|uniref:Branched-chain amino acid transport protein AzlD n=1 Tax=Parasporobacterium paucivorans DSM 15970 TaxID=1122934 RepID=A0A1M6D597_9FIRM|nr:Branched-chain amino acid transport protein AzlD [Parasporobacterium paucivorans DSM 15970]